MKSNLEKNCDHAFLMESVSALAGEYPFLGWTCVGTSVLGREIPLLRIGRGEKKLLLVGGVHGSEHITSALLLRFASDYLAAEKSGGAVYGLGMSYLYEKRSLYILPMLNPDGVEIAIHGPQSAGLLRERVSGMWDGDFRTWQANARGVDINHNFSAGFEEYKKHETRAGICPGPSRYSGEYPESEPESAAVAAFLRSEDIRLLAAFHSQGEELYYEYDGYSPPMGKAIAATLSRMCGYRLASPEGGAVYGGLKDMFIRDFDRPGYTFECGRGVNPLPARDLFGIYTRLRQTLFHLPVFA